MTDKTTSRSADRVDCPWCGARQGSVGAALDESDEADVSAIRCYRCRQPIDLTVVVTARRGVES